MSPDLVPGVPGAPLIAGALFLDGDVHLRVAAFNSQTTTVLTITGLLLTPDGRYQKFLHTLTPTTTRALSVATFPMAMGWLAGLKVVASAGTPLRGRCWVRVELVDTVGTGGTSLATVVQGYATATGDLAFPGAPLQTSSDGPGALRSITGTDPAANTEISETVPTGAVWRLCGFQVALVTDANVANREVLLTLDDGATIHVRAAAGAAQAAGVTRHYSFANYGTRGTAAVDPSFICALPDLRLAAGWRIRTLTSALQVGDNYGAPQLLVEEWIEG